LQHPIEAREEFPAASPEQNGFENTFCLVSQKMDSDLHKFLSAANRATKEGYSLPINDRLLMCRITRWK